MLKLVIVRGCSGSGKSTYAKSQNPLAHVEADMYWERPDGVYDFNFKYLKNAHSWCKDIVEKALEYHKGDSGDIIVSNTFTTFKEIEPYLDIAVKFQAGLEIVTMTGDYGDIHNVPEITLKKQKRRFEDHDTIQSKVEGYFSSRNIGIGK